MDLVFWDRQEAGKVLVKQLRNYKKNSLVLALPRGGVIVGYEVAKQLGVLLDVVVVRKLGIPWRKELGLGAIAEGDTLYVDQAAVEQLDIGEHILAAVKKEENKELQRRIRVYRDGHHLPSLSGKTVIIVDDGVATGGTMLAAIQAVKKQQPKYLVVAVPVCAKDTAEVIREKVDHLICIDEAQDMDAIGRYYQDFHQVTDEEVVELLHKNHEEIYNKKHLKPLGGLVAM